MQGWPYECCHWYFAVCVLPLSYLVVFSNHGFSFLLNWRQVKIKIWKGFFWFLFSLFWGGIPFLGLLVSSARKILLTISR